MTLHVDDEKVMAIALPTGHSDGDAIVYFQKANVVHMGDAFISINVPFHSKYAGGNILGLIDTLRKIVAMCQATQRSFRGMGRKHPLAMSDTRSSVLDEVKGAVSRQVAAGKTLDEMRAMNLLDPWKDSLGSELNWCLTKFYEALISDRPPGKATP